MKASPELREKMWELCYDLLPDGERSALIAQIKSDPHAARLYAEVRLQADLVGFASTVEDSSLILSADAEKLNSPEVAPAAGRRKEAAQAAHGPGKKSLWVANAVAVAAGLALVLVMAVGFFHPRDMEQQLARLMVIEIEVPGQVTHGLTTDFVVHTRSPAYSPVGVPLDVKVVNQVGDVLYREEIQTAAADGRSKFEVPGKAMVPGVRLQVEARREAFAEQQVAEQAAGELQGLGANFVEAELPVTRQEPLAYLLVEKPVAQEGEQVRIALWGVDRFGLTAAAPPVSAVVVKGLEASGRVQPQWSANKDNVAEGTIELSRAQALGAQSQPRGLALADGTQSRERVSLLRVEPAQDVSGTETFRRSGQSPPIAATETTAPDQPQQRRYADALEASPKLASAAAEDERSKELDKSKLDPAKQDIAPPRRRIIAADQPVEVDVSADQLGKTLEAKVMARGVEVVRQRVEPSMERFSKDEKGQEELAKIKLNVPREVDGNFDVTLAVPSADGDQLVHEQQFYRLPARELKFQVLNLQKRYDPGERVQLQFKVVNENDEPQVASHVGARLWNEDYVPDDRAGLVMLDDVVRQQEPRDAGSDLKAEFAQFGRPRSGLEGAVALGGAMPGARRALPEGNFYKESLHQLAEQVERQPLADQKKAEEPAAGAAAASPPTPAPSAPAGGPQLARAKEDADEALAMPADANVGGDVLAESARAFAAPSAEVLVEPNQVTIASNKVAIDRQMQSLKTEDSRALAAWQAMVGRVLIGGSLVALAILGLLFIMQQQVRWSSGTLALVASAASLVIGAAWITGDRQEMTIAMVPGSSGRATVAATPRPMEAAPKAASPRYHVEVTTDSLPTIASAEDAYAAPAGRADMPAAAPTIAPAPPKAANGELESLAPAAAPLAAAAAADKVGDEGKAAEGLEKLVPAKPATAAIQPGGKNQAKPAEPKQVYDNAAVPAPVSGGGLGGFGGGLGRGGLGGAAGSARADPRQGAADRSDSPKAASVRAGGAAGPAGTSPAPAAPSLAADVLRDLDRGSTGEKRKAADEAVAPSAIYFNPQLTTDNSGIVTLEFQLPTVASEYRLLLDAYGNGRVGSSADVRIVCKAAE